MNLKESYGTRVWEDATVEGLITDRLNRADGGAVESTREQVEILSSIVANLVETVARNDQEALDIIGNYGWEIAK
ncbi:hypothetical protein H0A64_09830 [Alcaligenaceae bacterium]|nr:hypothetical protein [Alcaligenaceae bacterium]